MPVDQAARTQIAQRGLTAAAAEVVARTALSRMPPSIVARATTQLRRLFSDGSWSAEDDAALAAAVGPGSGWFEEPLDEEVTLSFGWRGGAFRAEPKYTPGDDGTADASDDPSAAGGLATVARTLGDTFEEAVVLEAGRTPAELCFRVGPGANATGTFTRAAAADPRVAALFEACPALAQVTAAAGTLTATVDDAKSWPDELLDLFDAITAQFAPARPAPTDRQLERARSELGSLRATSPRDLARILDATTSPDAAYRRTAIERLDGAEAAAALRPLTRGLEDSSRAVRRVTARVLASSAHKETRDLLERALADGDACVRYYAVRGLDAIGAARNHPGVMQRRGDTDVRVHLAAVAASDGITPP